MEISSVRVRSNFGEITLPAGLGDVRRDWETGVRVLVWMGCTRIKSIPARNGREGIKKAFAFLRRVARRTEPNRFTVRVTGDGYQSEDFTVGYGRDGYGIIVANGQYQGHLRERIVDVRHEARLGLLREQEELQEAKRRLDGAWKGVAVQELQADLLKRLRAVGESIRSRRYISYEWATKYCLANGLPVS